MPSKLLERGQLYFSCEADETEIPRVLETIGDDWIVRAVNTTPIDLAHRGSRLRTMEELWGEFKPPGGA